MPLVHLVIFIVVTVGLQHATSQSNHCQMELTKHQCTPGPGERIFNSGNVWDPTQEEYGGIDENWNCKVCCQLQGKTIPHCDQNIGQNNNQQTNQGRRSGNQQGIQGRRFQNRNNNRQHSRINHCPMRNTKDQCTPGPGQRNYNTGTVWDPSQEQDGGVDEQWNCKPCCQFQGKTIPQCDQNLGQNNNQQTNQGRSNRNQGRRPQSQGRRPQNQGGRPQNRNQRNHCPMMKTKDQCTPGPGRRIYNTGTVWDPSQEQDGGVDENWNCKPCCQFNGKTIPQCNQNMGQNNNQPTNQGNSNGNQRRRPQNRPQNNGRRPQNRNNNQQQSQRNHCPMNNTKHQCTSGPGRRIDNSGTVWDPSREQDAGVDENWHCKPCCLLHRKTIPLCDPDMGGIM